MAPSARQPAGRAPRAPPKERGQVREARQIDVMRVDARADSGRKQFRTQNMFPNAPSPDQKMKPTTEGPLMVDLRADAHRRKWDDSRLLPSPMVCVRHCSVPKGVGPLGVTTLLDG